MPAAKRGTPWDEVLPHAQRTRRAAALTSFLDTNVLIRHLTGAPGGEASGAVDQLALVFDELITGRLPTKPDEKLVGHVDRVLARLGNDLST